MRFALRFRRPAACAVVLSLTALPTSAAAQQEAWTLVVLPDTQGYSRSFPWLYDMQTQWIADNRSALNIRFVLHEGDITNDNNTAQWSNASISMRILDNAGVPYAIGPGNHDYGPSGNGGDRSTLMSSWFSVSRFAAMPTYGGSYEPNRSENTYHTFQAGGRDWLALALEFGPRDPVVDWADQVVAAHPNHLVMLVTHSYTFLDGSRMDRQSQPNQIGSPYDYGLRFEPGGVNDGEELWDKLVSKHPNFALVFSGHLSTFANRQSVFGQAGNSVHEMLADYQNRPFGGEGYLRILEFLEDGRTVRVSTYSPWLDQYLSEGSNEFTLEPVDNHGLGSVASARFAVDGPGNSASVTIAGESGPWSVVRENEGDISPAIHGYGGRRGQGVLLATVAENGRDHGAGERFATAEVVQRGAFPLLRELSIATAEAGPASTGATVELNIHVAAAFFPFAGGWLGGHLRTVGDLPDGAFIDGGAPGIDIEMVDNYAAGRFRLRSPGVHSVDDGILLAVGGSDDDNAVSAPPNADGSGWEIGVRDSAGDLGAYEQGSFSFVFVPFSATGLVGGRVAEDGSVLSSAGSFSLLRSSPGVYRLTVPGHSPDTGVLLLTVAGLRGADPDDNILSYEAEGSDFVIESRDLPGLLLEDASFVFAYVPYQGGLAVQPVVQASELVAGEWARVEAGHFTPNSPIVAAYSFMGGTPSPTSAGPLFLAPPAVPLPPLTADPDGRARLLLQMPASLQDRGLWFQAYDPVASRLSNAFSRTVR